MEDDKMDIEKKRVETALPDKTEREKIEKMSENPLVTKDIKINSSVDGLNQAATPNNDLEPGFSTTTESDES